MSPGWGCPRVSRPPSWDAARSGLGMAPALTVVGVGAAEPCSWGKSSGRSSPEAQGPEAAPEDGAWGHEVWDWGGLGPRGLMVGGLSLSRGEAEGLGQRWGDTEIGDTGAAGDTETEGGRDRDTQSDRGTWGQVQEGWIRAGERRRWEPGSPRGARATFAPRLTLIMGKSWIGAHC